jgi:GAF domain-containing protein
MMDSAGGDGWSQAFPWLARTGRSPRLRALLAVAETVHRDSAVLMRSLGKEDLARQAELFAARVRFDLDDPVAAQRLYGLARDLRELSSRGSLLDKALEGALALSGAERGNVQILDPETGSLTIAAQYGFGAEFLDYFAVVDDAGTACGRAAANRAQIVIADVGADPCFEPHRDMAAASGFRAVQSTPLLDLAGRLVGVISTHYPRPYQPSGRDLMILKRYGELVGETMATRL